MHGSVVDGVPGFKVSPMQKHFKLAFFQMHSKKWPHRCKRKSDYKRVRDKITLLFTWFITVRKSLTRRVKSSKQDFMFDTHTSHAPSLHSWKMLKWWQSTSDDHLWHHKIKHRSTKHLDYPMTRNTMRLWKSTDVSVVLKWNIMAFFQQLPQLIMRLRFSIASFNDFHLGKISHLE